MGQTNLPATESFVCAVHWAVLHFRAYLQFTQFRVLATGRPEVLLLHSRTLPNRILMYLLELASFDFDFVPAATSTWLPDHQLVLADRGGGSVTGACPT